MDEDKRLNKHWSEKEDEYLKDNYGLVPIPQISNFLQRSEYAIRWRASALGITKKEAKQYWTKEELIFLSENLSSHTYQDLANMLGRSLSSVTHKIFELRIPKELEHDNIEDNDIEKGIPYRKGKSNEFLRKLAKMKIGDSFLYPASERQTLQNMIKYLPDRYFKTKKEGEETRRIWRLL